MTRDTATRPARRGPAAEHAGRHSKSPTHLTFLASRSRRIATVIERALQYGDFAVAATSGGTYGPTGGDKAPRRGLDVAMRSRESRQDRREGMVRPAEFVSVMTRWLAGEPVGAVR